MASAQCNFNPLTGEATGCDIDISTSVGGMYYGKTPNGMTEVSMGDDSSVQLSGFKWGYSNPDFTPQYKGSAIATLNFKFGDQGSNEISGATNSSDSSHYNITIKNTNKTFLLNAGDKTLNLNNRLVVDFAKTEGFTYYLKAKKLTGTISLSNGGTFIAYLADGLGGITNSDTNATFHFTSPDITLDINYSGYSIRATGTGSNTIEAKNTNLIANHKIVAGDDQATSGGTNDIKVKSLTIGGEISATNGGRNIINAGSLDVTQGGISASGGSNTLTLKGAGGANSSISGNIIANGGENNFTLDSGAGATALTLKGGTNQITNFTALGGDTSAGRTNTLTIASATTNEITNLVLGSKDAKGLLTIDNKGSVLTITNFESKYTDSTLTISKGEVNIGELVGGETNNNHIILSDNTILTLNGGNLKSLTTAGTTAINFAKGTTTIKEPISAGTENNFKLTGATGGTSATFNGAIGGTANNFELNSANGATTLTLGGAENAIGTFTALGKQNTLTLNSNTATADKNTIANLVLGDDTQNATKAGLLTISNGSSKALTITDFESKHAGSTLTISAGEVVIKNAIGADNNNFTLSNATLTLNNASGGSGTSSTITSLTTTAGENTINLNAGETTITEQVKAESRDISNNFNITGKLTLSQGFSTKNGGKNAFVINSGGELVVGNNQLDGGLTTTNGTTEFIIKENAKFDLLNDQKAIEAITNGTNIIDTAVSFDLGEIKANGGINNIILRGTAGGSPTNMAVGAITKNGGANNFKLDSTNGATALTLKGKDNSISTLTAFGGNDNKLTITNTTTGTNKIEKLNLGDNGTAKGSLTIENSSGKVLEITDFASQDNGNILTIGVGEVKIKNALKNTADINFTLSNATLTLNNANGDSTIANLTTTGTNNINFVSGTTTITSANGITAGSASVKNNISLGEGATLASAITADGASAENTITLANNSSITKDITATNGTNTITLTGTSATITGNLIQNSGANKISFDSQLESQTLHLKGNSNTITTLTLNNQSNNTINLAGDKDGISSRTNEFRLLTIGTKPTSSSNTDTGLLNPNGATLTFESYINPKANNQSQTPPSNKVTLGKEEITVGNDGKATNTYGYAYSDRVIIHNAGDNSGQGQGKYKFKAHYSNSISENDLKSINYTKDKGTEQEGNIALFTIAKDSSGQGIIEFDTQDNNNSQIKSTTRAGLDAITTTLIKVSTDQYGKTVDDSGNVLGDGEKKYFTYFVNKIQQGSAISDEGRNIARDANLMIQSMAVSAVNLYLANFNSLNKRMGELRDNAYSKGVWARTFIGSQSNELGLSDQMGYFSIQAGFDGALKREKANNFIGFAISYSKNFGYSSTKNNARSLNSGVRAPELGIDSLNSQLLELAVYNSYVADSGWYNDTIGKFSYIQNSMSVKDRLGANAGGINGASGKFNTFALTLSNEVGYRAKLGEDKAWFIDPQAELAIGHINGVNFSLNHYRINQAANASISSAINIRARAGASIGYDFKNFTQDKGIDAKVYVGAFYEMDYFHYTDGSQGIKYTTKLKDTREVKMLDTDHRAVLNVGTNLTIKDATRLYLDFEKSFGGKITTDYKINAGVRYSFGENAGYKSNNAVQKDNEVKEAPLKLQEEEEEE